MKYILTFILSFIVAFLFADNATVTIKGETKVMHVVQISFTHDTIMCEDSTTNPFLDYRLVVVLTHATRPTKYLMGFFNADDSAATTQDSCGTQWAVRFIPTATGDWTYKAYFSKGSNVRLNTYSLSAGSVIDPIDGTTGTISVTANDKTGDDFRAKGKLQYANNRYLRHSLNGDWFYRSQLNSPEDWLGCSCIDSTFDYTAGGTDYTTDWMAMRGWYHDATDPNGWGPDDTLGRGMYGALNYLDSMGVNSIYFLTYNIDGGDADNTWPWLVRDTQRFDVSKLEQWDLFFSHADSLGIELCAVLWETENDTVLGQNAPYRMSVARKLYLMELAARFTTHLGWTWIAGEELNIGFRSNGDMDTFKVWLEYLDLVDPYDSPVFMHTRKKEFGPGVVAQIEAMYGYEHLDGLSLQANATGGVNNQTNTYVDGSIAAGRPWVVTNDESGKTGTSPFSYFADTTTADTVEYLAFRNNTLWHNYLAGGGGVGLYVQEVGRDQSLDSLYLYDDYYKWMAQAERIMERLPSPPQNYDGRLFENNLVTPSGLVFGEEGVLYLIYTKDMSGGLSLKIRQSCTSTYTVKWIDPRASSFSLINGSVLTVTPPNCSTITDLGSPPNKTTKDWLVVVYKQ